MIETGYFANLKNYPENEMFLVVSRYYPRWLRKGLPFHPELAPSKKLLGMWKTGGLGWEAYESIFREEMKSPAAQKTIKALVFASKVDSFRLLCYEKNPPCHRFILKELILEAEES